MSQETRVFALSAGAVSGLEQTLQGKLPGHTEWRSVPHARFACKVDGVVLTCYNSGKLVLQGQGLDGFCARFLSDLPASDKPSQKSNRGDLPLVRATIGSDEAGKGDYFGPLVVAAVYCRAEDATRLQKIGVTDSKSLTDKRCRLLAGKLQNEFDHRIETLMPPNYNQRYDQVGNLNHMLADLHASAVMKLAKAHPEASEILIDKFANESLLATRLSEVTRDGPELVQVVRAERNTVVAAASILARTAFLDGLKQCAQSCGSDLAKGAGTPVDQSAQRVYEIGGMDLIAKVAKIHFKNSGKIRGAK